MDEAYLLSCIAELLQKEHSTLGTWEAVAKKYNAPKGTLHRVATEPGYCPHWLRVNIRQIIKQQYSYRSLFDMPVSKLREAYENRKEVPA